MIALFRRMLLIALALPFVTGCDGALTFLAGETPGGDLVASHWAGQDALLSSASYRTARTDPEWQALWHDAGQAPPFPALPSGKMAIGIFLGQRFTPGETIDVISTASERRRTSDPFRPVILWRVVQATSETKASDASADSHSPWVIRLIDDSVLPPEFRQSTL